MEQHRVTPANVDHAALGLLARNVDDIPEIEPGYHLVEPPWVASVGPWVWPAGGVPIGWIYELLLLAYAYTASATAATRTHQIRLVRGASTFGGLPQSIAQTANQSATLTWITGGAGAVSLSVGARSSSASLGRLLLPRQYAIQADVNGSQSNDTLSAPLISYIARRSRGPQ